MPLVSHGDCPQSESWAACAAFSGRQGIQQAFNTVILSSRQMKMEAHSDFFQLIFAFEKLKSTVQL